ncbi:MAG: TraB/GumN family protein [Rhodobacter sp.]
MADGPALAAFGALHLSGPDGVLALLQQAGFAVERLEL